MINIQGVYVTVSLVILILITTFYLIDLTKYHANVYSLYQQANTPYTLTSSSAFRSLSIFNNTVLTNNLEIGKFRMSLLNKFRRTGRYIIILQTSGVIDFQAIDNKKRVLSKKSWYEIKSYTPIYIDFSLENDTEFLDLQYKTTSSSIIMDKLSIEFF